jgi:hypothetical protein
LRRKSRGLLRADSLVSVSCASGGLAPPGIFAARWHARGLETPSPNARQKAPLNIGFPPPEPAVGEKLKPYALIE